jgi:FkbM family methyltransferase
MKASSIVKYLVDSAERNSSLRWLLARGISAYASMALKRRIQIFYDSVWLRQDGQTVVALGPKLRLRRDVNWIPEGSQAVDTWGSYWLRYYRPKPGDTVIDIGGGMGDDTLLFSRMVGPSGRVFSFEAHPDTFRCLQKAIEHSQSSNVIAVYGAIFSEKGTLQIDGFSEEWKANSVMRTTEGVERAFLEVPAFRLDDFEPLHELDIIQFLKMNIEGAEVEALLGMPKILAKVDHACVACHDFLGDTNSSLRTKARCKEILLNAGFHIFETGIDCPPWQRDHLHCYRH